MASKLRAVEKELGGVLAAIVVGHGVGTLELPVLALEGLDQAHEDQAAAQLVAVVLAEINGPVLGILLQLEDRGGTTDGGGRGGGDGGEPLLELLDGLLPEGSAHYLKNRGVEGDVGDEVGHVCR